MINTNFGTVVRNHWQKQKGGIILTQQKGKIYKIYFLQINLHSDSCHVIDLTLCVIDIVSVAFLFSQCLWCG